METLKAWHGDKKLKQFFMARLKEHQRLEHLVQGTGFKKNGQVKSRSIGCLFDHYDRAKGAQEFGIPEALLRLADTIFERLPKKEANDFALEWPEAIKPGADLSRVEYKFCAFILTENIERVRLLKIEDELKEQAASAIQDVLNLHEQEAAWSAGGIWSAEEAARARARSAEALGMSAEAAAAAEARAKKAAAAWSAARSATAAAGRIVAARVRAEEAAKVTAYKRYAAEFIRLLKS